MENTGKPEPSPTLYVNVSEDWEARCHDETQLSCHNAGSNVGSKGLETVH